MANPYSTIFARLEEILATVPDVRVGNRVGAARAPHKTDPASFIAALVRVRPAPGGIADTRATSSSGRFVQNFTVELATDQEAPGPLFDVKWAVLLAFHDAGPNLGLPDLVTRTEFIDLSEAHDNADLTAGRVYAWSSVVTVAVEFRPKVDQFRNL